MLCKKKNDQTKWFLKNTFIKNIKSCKQLLRIGTDGRDLQQIWEKIRTAVVNVVEYNWPNA